ncbi:hypothetical protein L1887_01029 [Cichorium endivia]|nr:hypothetical protein L1887_01029 [Cichorium endivia]
MPNEEYDDNQRQFLCISKYEKIVNQFDELINMVDMVTKAPKRHRRLSSNSRSKLLCKNGGRGLKASGEGAEERSCTNGIKGSMLSSTENGTESEVLVQLIANHLHDLNHPHKA